jgi:hypothetical protein
MFSHPNEKRAQLSNPLINQFVHKGYICQQIQEAGSTVTILTNEKKKKAQEEAEKIMSRLLLESYKEALKKN